MTADVYALPQKFADQKEAYGSGKNPTEGEVGEVQRASRHDLLRALGPRYAHVGKSEKSQILDQLCDVTKYTRKYALTLLKHPPPDEPPVMGRCAQVGDDLGSRVVAARLVRELIHLCFLLERQYAPYTKWFRTAFSRLACADRLLRVLTAALSADDWRERERHLTDAYEVVATMHNDLGLTEPLPIEASPFHGRPFLVIHGDRFADALTAAIEDTAVRVLPRQVGSINQWVDSTDVLSYPDWYDRLRPLYES